MKKTPHHQPTRPETAAKQQTVDLKVSLKPGFDADHPVQAEIDLIGRFLSEILQRMNSGKTASDD